VILAGRDRRAAPMGAPAHGLFLHEVVYPHELLSWEPPLGEARETGGEGGEGEEGRDGGGEDVGRRPRLAGPSIGQGLRDMLNS